MVIFSALVGLAYLKLRNRDSEQADFFRCIIDSLYGIVMCIVKMVIGLTPYGVMALIANVMATSDFAAIVSILASSLSSRMWRSSRCSSCI